MKKTLCPFRKNVHLPPCVTRHISHVMFHMSHFMGPMSRVTCCMSHVTIFLSMEFWGLFDYLFTLDPTLASLVFRAIGLDTINNIQGRLCRLPLNSVLANLTYSFFYNKSPSHHQDQSRFIREARS